MSHQFIVSHVVVCLPVTPVCAVCPQVLLHTHELASQHTHVIICLKQFNAAVPTSALRAGGLESALGRFGHCVPTHLPPRHRGEETAVYPPAGRGRCGLQFLLTLPAQFPVPPKTAWHFALPED